MTIIANYLFILLFLSGSFSIMGGLAYVLEKVAYK
jgi:hypothetical protein